VFGERSELLNRLVEVVIDFPAGFHVHKPDRRRPRPQQEAVLAVSSNLRDLGIEPGLQEWNVHVAAVRTPLFRRAGRRA